MSSLQTQPMHVTGDRTALMWSFDPQTPPYSMRLSLGRSTIPLRLPSMRYSRRGCPAHICSGCLCERHLHHQCSITSELRNLHHQWTSITSELRGVCQPVPGCITANQFEPKFCIHQCLLQEVWSATGHGTLWHSHNSDIPQPRRVHSAWVPFDLSGPLHLAMPDSLLFNLFFNTLSDFVHNDNSGCLLWRYSIPYYLSCHRRYFEFMIVEFATTI